MVAKIYTSALVGLNPKIVEVEVDVAKGFADFQVVGLADKAIQESKERIISSLRNSGFPSPLSHAQKVTVNLAPAHLKKDGTHYDLPIALGYLYAKGLLNFDTKNKLFLGELSLDGRLRRVKGVLPIILFVKKKGFKEIYLPNENIGECSLISGRIKIFPINHLWDLMNHFKNEKELPSLKIKKIGASQERDLEFDFKFIKGQEYAKRALEIAASGNHNVLMEGAPGGGKTFLARAFASILPRMRENEILEASSIYSIAGLLNEEQPLILDRPFRSPHHSSSLPSIIGGGQNPRPGEITLAHRGVLFLDEFTEFDKRIIEALRQPLEDRKIVVSRARGTISYPCNFTLIIATNPCPCGYFGDETRECKCSPYEISKYTKKLSGPILDRIDLKVFVRRITFEKLVKEEYEEDSAIVRERVEAARAIQLKRFKGSRIKTNAEMGQEAIKKFCKLDKNSKKLIKEATEKFSLSARSYFRVLKVARTIADLEGKEEIDSSHLSEAIGYKVGEKEI